MTTELPRRAGRVATATAIGVYVVAILEVVVMSTPFATYYYGAYSPLLSALQGTPYLSWLGAFFVTHISEPNSNALAALKASGLPLFALGMALFLTHAIYLYWMKFVKKAVATRLLYGYVLHPQYLALMVAGLGLAIMWPRFLNLILYLVMLAVYSALARHEERRMERDHDQAYGRYRLGKGRFLPGNPGGRLGDLLFGWLPNNRSRSLAVLLGFFVVVLVGAVWLRGRSADSLHVLIVGQAPKTLVIAFDPPAREFTTQLAAASVRQFGRREDDDTRPDIVYLIWDRSLLRHFLIDGGVDRAAVKEEQIPEASYYVVAANVFASGQLEQPTPALDPRRFLGASMIRKLTAVVCVHASEQIASEEYPIPQEARLAHISLPVL